MPLPLTISCRVLLGWALLCAVGPLTTSAWTLPDRTVGASRVSDFKAAANLYGQIEGEQKLVRFSDRFGVDPDRLAAFATGPAWRLAIANEQTDPADVFLLQCEDANHADEAAAALQDEGTAEPAIQWRSSGRWIAASTNAGLRERALTAVVAGETESEIRLPNMPAFSSDTSGLSFHWWVDPWAELQARAESQPEDEGAQAAWRSVQRHKLTGTKAWGGATVLPDSGRPLAEAFAFAPEPREGSLAMLTARPASSLSVPAWLAGAPSILVINADVPRAFDNADLLFDDLLADGIDGTYRDILADLKSPDGLDVDLVSDLYPHLGSRVYLVRGEPADGEDPPIAVIFTTDDVEPVAQAFETLMASDPEVTHISRPEAGGEIWRINASELSSKPCLATVHGHAVYASDTRLLLNLLDKPTAEQQDRLRGVNESLERSVAASPPPAMALVGMPPKQPEEQASHEARAAAIRSFFDTPADEAPAAEDIEALTGFIDRLFAGRTVLGFAESDGWRFTESAAPSTD